MNRTSRLFGIAGAVTAGLAVALGAFAAHLLRAKLDPAALQIFETGVRYQMYHGLALFAVAWVSGRTPSSWCRTAGTLFLIGTILFSGSLYALALTSVQAIGLVTPLGGVAFVLGWLSFAMTFRRSV